MVAKSQHRMEDMYHVIIALISMGLFHIYPWTKISPWQCIFHMIYQIHKKLRLLLLAIPDIMLVHACFFYTFLDSVLWMFRCIDHLWEYRFSMAGDACLVKWKIMFDIFNSCLLKCAEFTLDPGSIEKRNFAILFYSVTFFFVFLIWWVLCHFILQFLPTIGIFSYFAGLTHA